MSAATPDGSLARAGQRLVVVVAHPDDETFGCGSIIAAAAAAGAQVTVLCATLGEAGERRPNPTTDHLPLAEVREGELRAAAEILGVHSIELLGHADSGFDGPLPAGALCAVDVASLGSRLAARFAALAADVVVILDGGDGHRDHRHVRAAVESAFAQQAIDARLVLSCLPNSLMRRWVAEMHAQASDTAYLALDLDTLGTPDRLLTPLDVAHVLDRREAAIACHRSQSSPYDTLSGELRAAFLSVDHVQITPAPPR